MRIGSISNVLIATLRENSVILAGPQAEMDYVCLYCVHRLTTIICIVLCEFCRVYYRYGPVGLK